MRVALVIEQFDPDGGGMEAVAWTVAHGLAAAGDEVHVIVRKAKATAAVEIHRTPGGSSWQPLRVMAFSKRAAAATRDRFDVVHAFSRTLHQDVYRAGGGSHADYMLRAYGPRGTALRRLTPRHALLLGLERRIFRDPAQLIQCGSRMVRGEIEARFGVPGDRLHVIHNGVDSDRYHPPADHLRAPLPDAAAVDGPIWLFAGSGWHRKGLDTAISALARGRERGAHLRVVGRDAPGPWRELARRSGVGERVEFLGPRRDIDAVYRAADALILPTRYDAFANVCLEAAASGLPVVTSGANGSGELLGEAGIVVDDPEDADGFAAALDRMCDDERRRAYGRRGVELAQSLTWARHIEQLQGLYQKVRARRPRRAPTPLE